MDISYKYVNSTVKPTEIEFTNSTVYLRKNIRQETRRDDRGDEIFWAYDEAAMTPHEFNQYSSEIIAENALKGRHDSDHIASIMTGQTAGSDNQMTIMEAIADLYDMVFNLQNGGAAK